MPTTFNYVNHPQNGLAPAAAPTSPIMYPVVTSPYSGNAHQQQAFSYSSHPGYFMSPVCCLRLRACVHEQMTSNQHDGTGASSMFGCQYSPLNSPLTAGGGSPYAMGTQMSHSSAGEW
jgi:hypothetical protein